MKRLSLLQHMLLSALAILVLLSCDPAKKASAPSNDGKIDITILHINDVYEIAPLEGGKIGGMARLATLRKQLKQKNSNTFTVHAGDFLNPSLIGTLELNGEGIRGRQMIEAMNMAGVDLATFGNHEFDLKEADLQKRLNESAFSWTSANCLQNKQGLLSPFYIEKAGSKNVIPETFTYVAQDADGTQIKIGFFSVTLPSNPQDYVHYEDIFEEAKKAYQALSGTCDVVLGLTHLEIGQDLQVAKMLPGVPLIMGGHEHDNMFHKVGNSYVAKADANVKSAYVHHLSFDHKTKATSIQSELVMLDEKIDFDPQVAALVDRWNKILLTSIVKIVPNPTEIIYTAPQPLDGRESSIRNQQTNLGEVITQAMLMASSEGAVAAIQNSGSIRIDDQISGAVTPVDIFRALPYGGEIFDVELTGQLLKAVLDYGLTKKGSGAYLQWGNISWDAPTTTWMINKKALDPGKNYKIMLNDYLMKGIDIPILKNDSPGIISVKGPGTGKNDPKSDVRIAVINYLKSL